MKKIIFLFLGGMALSLGKSQSVDYLKFTHYTTANGLGNSNIRKSIQDSKGFIWSATQDGLYRFNGNHFITYNKSSPEKFKLTGSVILDMLEHDSILWVVNAFGGVDAINIITGEVIYQLDQQKNSIYKDALLSTLSASGDTLFIGSSKGLLLLTMHDKKLLPAVKIHAAIPGSATFNINKLVIDRKKNHLWLFCAGQGVYLLNSQSLAVISFLPEKTDFIYDADLSADHSVFAGTSGGIRKYSLDGNTIIRINTPFPFLKETLATNVYVMRQHKGKLYFSNKNHLIKINPVSGQYQYIKENRFGKEQNWTEAVFGVLFDKDDNLWLSCVQGLAFANNQPTPFISYHKSAVSQDLITRSYSILPYNDSVIYISADDGFYKINPGTGAIKTLDKGKQYYFSFIDHNANLVVSNDEGTFVLRGNILIPFEKIYPEFAGKSKLVLNSCIPIGDSAYILGSQNKRGIFTWNYTQKKITNITSAASSATPLRLQEDVINTIYRDKSGMVWLLSDNSVMLYDLTKQTIRPVPLIRPDNQKRYTIFFDIREINHRFYISSYGHGVIVLDKDRGYLKEISVANGLANNGVYKLLNYKDSLLMVTTNNGLSAMKLSDYSIKNYYAADGLHSNEFEEFSGNTNKNILYAGGADGVTRINPAYFTANTTPPALFWNKVSIETQSGITDTSNLHFGSLEIPNNAIQTTISFSALNYNNPTRTGFSYKINELHKDWINIKAQDFINLIGLSPGKYTLQVKAVNEDGIWSKEPITLSLHFLPKWYQTLLFKIVVIGMIAGLIYAFFRYRINQIKSRQKIRKDIAGDLHDDIGSTLNSVKVFVHLVRKHPGKEEHLNKIEESLTQASAGLRDMIWVLDNSQDNLLELSERVKKFAIPVTSAQDIAFECMMDPEIHHHKITKTEKRNLLLIAKESINNSIKYAESKKITLEIKLVNGKITILITDNGKGFDTVNSQKGNGLTNIAYRASQIKYTSSIISDKTGTFIRLEKK